jgi:hemoglobin-like flavoprotein
MQETQKQLVQTSFAKVLPIAGAAADLFYNRLFELDPALRPLFKADLTEQKLKLMQMLATAVRGLDDLGTLVPAVRALGARHNGYGVKDEHYETVGAALLWTLEKGLGSDFTAETKDAWIAVYAILAATMKEGSKGTPTAAAG